MYSFRALGVTKKKVDAIAMTKFFGPSHGEKNAYCQFLFWDMSHETHYQ